MKKILAASLAAMALSIITLYAQEDAELGPFERCNNWARHYCQNDYHAKKVDAELLRLKQAGHAITLTRIKSLAQRIKPLPDEQEQ